MEVLSQPVGSRACRGALRDRNRMPFRVVGLQDLQGFRALVEQDTVPRKFHVPVGSHREGLQLRDRHYVERGPRSRLRPEKGELMGRLGRADFDSLGYAASKGVQDGADVRLQDVEVRLRAVKKANTAGQAVDRESPGTDHFRKRTSRHAKHSLQSEGAVLRLAETQAVPGVLVRLSLDVRDTVPVSADDHGAFDSGHGQVAAGDRQPPS